MTADFAADMTANVATSAIVQPMSQAIAGAQQFLVKGIELANIREFERAITHFTGSIGLSLAILKEIKQDPIIDQRSLSAAEVTATQSFYHRGCALCRLEQYEKAIADFTHLIHQPPTSSAIPADWLITKLTEIYIHRGNAYRRLGEYSQALADLNQSISRAGSAQSYGCRGLLYLDTNDFEKAITDFDQALSLHPTFSQGYLWRGFARVRSGEYALSIEDLDRAISAIPNCAEAFNHRGLAYFYLNDLDKAKSDFSQAVQIDSGFAEAYNNRGNILQLLGDSAAANVDYERAISLTPQQSEIYLNRIATNNADEIISRLDSEDASFYRHRAATRASGGKWKEAIADYTTAIELSPTANTFYQRGKLYRQINELEAALSDFDAAIEQSPNYGVVYSDRAQLRFKLNDLSGTLSDIQKNTELRPNPSKEILVTCCLTQFLLGKQQQALQDFEQLIRQIQSSSQTSKESTSIGSVGG